MTGKPGAESELSLVYDTFCESEVSFFSRTGFRKHSTPLGLSLQIMMLSHFHKHHEIMFSIMMTSQGQIIKGYHPTKRTGTEAEIW